MAASIGALAQMGWGDTSTVDLPFEFLNESIRLSEELLDTSGIRGTRSHNKEGVRQGTRRVEGSVSMNPTAVELSRIIPRAFGAAASGTTYALGDTFTAFYLSVDRVQKVFLYDTCFIDRITFRASSGQLLEVTCDICGKDETVNAAGTHPALTLDITTQPFVFSDLVLVINSVTHTCFDFELTVDNMRDKERFLNSQTRSSFPATDRVVSLKTTLPYGDSSAAYALSAGGVAATATFTNGATSLLFTLPAIQVPRESPVVSSKGEIQLPINAIARKSGSTSECTVTLDSIP